MQSILKIKRIREEISSDSVGSVVKIKSHGNQIIDTSANNPKTIVKNALIEKRVIAHYQPKLDFLNKRLVGFEALVRIAPENLSKNVIYPGEFIPFIEDSDLIKELGLSVLNFVLNDLMMLSYKGLYTEISINAAALQLQDPLFADQVISLIDATTGVSRDQIIIEVVETSAIANIEAVKATMRKLSNEGIRFHLDDFGTGYSSFSYLRDLPFSTLKIDQSFINSLLIDQRAEAVVRSCLSVATAFGVNVIAEGVEELSVANKLMELGCTTIQGYYVSKPVPSEKITKWLNKECADFTYSV